MILIFAGGVVAFVFFSVLWCVQKRIGDAGIVDVAWGTAIGLLAVAYCLLSNGLEMRRWIVASLTVIWAARLSGYVLIRLATMPEDGRYLALKKEWDANVDWKMYGFYQLQAFAAVLFSVPMWFAAQNVEDWNGWDYVGVTIWLIAMTGEWYADRQLHRFRCNPSNHSQVCQTGLWRYSRHPNYFFEWLHWWAYVFLAVHAPFGWITLFAPLLMLFFILRVTGIPPTEKQSLKSRGDAYRRYQQTTNAFFPWFPRLEKGGSN